jgi:murein DD-endopeptidase MepM/ murein hydrolase activator NlpD
MRNSLRLGVLLTALVGINVYVFFFNHGTAPREVLNLQSTSKSLDGAKLLAKDAQKAGNLLALAPTSSAGSAPKPSKPPAAAAPAGVAPPPRAVNVASAPVFKIPFAPPPEPTRPMAPAKGGAVQVPWAPPPEDDGESPVAEDGGLEKKFEPNITLGQVLAREGFGAQAGNVIAALSKLVDPKTIQVGQKYVVRLDEAGTPQSFEYQPSIVLRYLVEREDGDGEGAAVEWTASKAEQPVEVQTVTAAGVVESSLYESVQKAGESTTLVSSFVELFAWDINFYVDQHPGDHWKVVVEKQLLGGKFYKYGRVLAAEYGGKVGTFRAFYFAGRGKAASAPGRYYDDKGQAISKTMLKTPLRFVRISSKFDRKRLHPILHVEKAHLGIDYAAPVGTPVWASASGRVVEAAMKRGSGNTVVIAHSNGINTRYYHLSKFARGLRAGQTVKQKDVIGFVGTTGLSTGPHLHFSVTKNGAFVDPNKMQINRDAPVADRVGFMEAIRPRLAALRDAQPASVARN